MTIGTDIADEIMSRVNASSGKSAYDNGILSAYEYADELFRTECITENDIDKCIRDINEMLHDTRSDIYSRSDEFSDGETEYYKGECRGYEMILKSLKILGF